MDFYIREYRTTLLHERNFPCVILTTDNWNDNFIAQTLFHVEYQNGFASIDLGDVKIMHNQVDTTSAVIPKKFNQLDSNFCSLGQTLHYYDTLNKIDEKDKVEILKGLNDAAIHNEYKEKYEDHEFFLNSLVRFSEASKALKEASSIVGNTTALKADYIFQFKCKLPKADNHHEISFDFNSNDLPYRINAFVGKNATGKTAVLKEISKTLSGVQKSAGEFSPERPRFSKIITISYSAFDEMYKPFEDDDVQVQKNNSEEDASSEYDENKLFSYVYCGLRSSNGMFSIEEMETNFWRAYE